MELEIVKKSFHVDVVITDGQKSGRVLTVKHTSQNMFIFFDPNKEGLTKHFTDPKDGRIHMTYSLKGRGGGAIHEYWVPEHPSAWGREFRMSDSTTWGPQPREKANETVSFDVRNHIDSKPDKLTVVAMALEPAQAETTLKELSGIVDILLQRLVESGDGRWLAIVIYATKQR